ncbi:Hydrolase 4 domain-containing protein [Citrus sinensis]|uniref:Hydrolase 4 domain-containing protein n=1 Tax=Citrus sinensis TaxID=2711 RepID=A0ACB8IS26_CITSI|nr:Hydrolase 4 domain-containing protein [Citrus sinensis]
MVSKTAVVSLIGLLGMVYQATQLPPPPKSDPPGGFVVDIDVDDNGDGLVDAARIRLSDGRKQNLNISILKEQESNNITVEFGKCQVVNFTMLSFQELIESLGIYFVLYDRAGYGESDPNPRRTVKSEAFDIVELADQLQLGSKFYVIGVSIGSLAGVALIVPTINYEWPSLPQSLIRTDYRRRLIQWSLWIAKHIPGLLYWWITQKDVPSTSVLERNPVYFSDRDIEVLKTTKGFPMLTQDKLQDRSVFYALRGDVVAAFGDWGFDPVRLSNPFPHNESSVHIWQGYEDKVVPFQLQRFISRKLSWIKYHEVRDGGHLILHYNDVDNVSRLGLKGENCVLH